MIAFASDRDGAGFDVYVMDADGGIVTRLTDAAGDDVGPDWSPDGATIAFRADRGAGTFDLYTMTAAGSAQTRLTLADGTDELAAAWSPDGTKLALVLGQPSGSRRVAVVDADGSDLTPVTPDDFILGVDWQRTSTPDTVDPTVSITRPATPGRVFERGTAPVPQFTCTDLDPGSGVRSCRADVAKPNGTVVDDLPPGDHLPSATLGEYELRAEALDRALNQAVEVRPYTVVDHRPDGRIALGAGTLAGNDVYNTTGASQTRTAASAPNLPVTFNLSIQNHGNVDDQFRIRGQAEVGRVPRPLRRPRHRGKRHGPGDHRHLDHADGRPGPIVQAPGRGHRALGGGPRVERHPHRHRDVGRLHPRQGHGRLHRPPQLTRTTTAIHGRRAGVAASGRTYRGGRDLETTATAGEDG